ncbi:hypothetical protein BLN97_02965 [Bradyrhizobium elkanii]|nr:hypothetical protein BLN97_02965 [Bradyrhizobium elkanii]
MPAYPRQRQRPALGLDRRPRQLQLGGRPLHLVRRSTYRASLQDAGDNHSYKGTAGLRVVW